MLLIIPETRFVQDEAAVRVASRKRDPLLHASAQTTSLRDSICAGGDLPKDRRGHFQNRVPFVDSSYIAFLCDEFIGQGETSAVQGKILKGISELVKYDSGNKKAFVQKNEG